MICDRSWTLLPYKDGGREGPSERKLKSLSTSYATVKRFSERDVCSGAGIGRTDNHCRIKYLKVIPGETMSVGKELAF